MPYAVQNNCVCFHRDEVRLAWLPRPFLGTLFWSLCKQPLRRKCILLEHLFQSESYRCNQIISSLAISSPPLLPISLLRRKRANR